VKHIVGWNVCAKSGNTKLLYFVYWATYILELWKSLQLLLYGLNCTELYWLSMCILWWAFVVIVMNCWFHIITDFYFVSVLYLSGLPPFSSSINAKESCSLLLIDEFHSGLSIFLNFAFKVQNCCLYTICEHSLYVVLYILTIFCCRVIHGPEFMRMYLIDEEFLTLQWISGNDPYHPLHNPPPPPPNKENVNNKAVNNKTWNQITTSPVISHENLV
jgi:hypothetical protein